MQDVRVDEDGNLRCWKCGGTNFLEKRTGKAHIIGFATVGVGALATKKKLKCYQCGEFNQVGNAKAFSPQSGSRFDTSNLSLEDALITFPLDNSVLDLKPIQFAGVANRDGAVQISIQNAQGGHWHPKKRAWVTFHRTLVDMSSKDQRAHKNRKWTFDWDPQENGVYSVEVSLGMMAKPKTRRTFQVLDGGAQSVNGIARSESFEFVEAERPEPLSAPETGPLTPLTFRSSGGEMSRLSVANEIRKLAELRDEGLLSDDEFEIQKARLLNHP